MHKINTDSFRSKNLVIHDIEAKIRPEEQREEDQEARSSCDHADASKLSLLDNCKLKAISNWISKIPRKTKAISAAAIILCLILCLGAATSITGSPDVDNSYPVNDNVIGHESSSGYYIDENEDDTYDAINGLGQDTVVDAAPSAEQEAESYSDNAMQMQESDEQLQISSPDPVPMPIYLSDLPDWNGSSPYIEVNNNIPYFEDGEFHSAAGTEIYAPLDNLGRCQYAFAVVGKETQPTSKRGDISKIYPTGWQQENYSGTISGGWLYNRCHLIGHQLTAENANQSNLITGTQYMNIEGMLPLENKIDDYIDKTRHHVLYRAEPVFYGNDLLAHGVHLMAWSIEDGGAGISFNVFCYNVQPGIAIDYATGNSHVLDNNIAADTTAQADSNSQQPEATVQESHSNNGNMYILNTNSKKYHKPGCASADKISDANKQNSSASIEELENAGYSACKNCFK